MQTLGNDCHRQDPLLSEENLPGGLCFQPSPSWLFLSMTLAKATDSMWIRFVEDRKLGGIANVLDEGVGTKQTPAG